MTAGGFEMAPLSSDSAQIVHRFAGSGRHLAFWVVAWMLLGAGTLGVLVSLLSRGPPVSFQSVTVVFRIVGGSFAACGLVAWRRRPDNHSGRLMIATGVAFLVSPLLAQLDAPLARTAGLLLRNVWLLGLVVILLTFLTGGRLRTRVDRIIVGAVAVSLLFYSPVSLLVLDVEGNLLFVRPDVRVAAAIDAVQKWQYLPIALAVTGVVGARWWSASRPARRALLPSVAGSAYLLFFAAVLTAGLVGVALPFAVYWILAVSVAVVPAAFLAGLLRSRLARGGLVELFRGMQAMRPGDLRDALARALGDPSLVIAYPVTGGFVDSDARPVAMPGAGGGRSVAPVGRDGEVIAALVYDRSLDDDPELVEAVGGAAAIALENQHLHVEAETRLAEVLASRERAIAAGDAERRRIERNLHDGAQQRLITLALHLSLIGRQIRVAPGDAEQLVTEASDELAQSLEELRELARGIHPAALDQGLDVALAALALRSAVPTTVSCDPGPHLPQPVAFTAYLVASEALANIAKYAHATTATVRLVRSVSGTVIEVADDGIGGADPARGSGLRGLADRVEAIGGSLRLTSPAGHGTVVSARLPNRG